MVPLHFWFTLYRVVKVTWMAISCQSVSNQLFLFLFHCVTFLQGRFFQETSDDNIPALQHNQKRKRIPELRMVVDSYRI